MWVVVGLGGAVAAAAALRSTWSPCGQSMLSQITPFTERARDQRFAATACWFVFGAAVGGAMVGAAAALGAAGLAVADLGREGALVAVVALSLAAAAVDAGLAGPRPPFFRRQVNEDWLPRYRGWLYGAGFGWQVGVGVATYIMTAAVFLTIALAMLTTEPWAAFAIGVCFGAVRGLTVFLTARVHRPAQLQSFHRTFDRWAEPVRVAVVAVQVAAAAVAAVVLWGALGLVASLAVVGLSSVVVVARTRRARPADAQPAPASTLRAHA